MAASRCHVRRAGLAEPSEGASPEFWDASIAGMLPRPRCANERRQATMRTAARWKGLLAFHICPNSLHRFLCNPLQRIKDGAGEGLRRRLARMTTRAVPNWISSTEPSIARDRYWGARVIVENAL